MDQNNNDQPLLRQPSIDPRLVRSYSEIRSERRDNPAARPEMNSAQRMISYYFTMIGVLYLGFAGLFGFLQYQSWSTSRHAILVDENPYTRRHYEQVSLYFEICWIWLLILSFVILSQDNMGIKCCCRAGDKLLTCIFILLNRRDLHYSLLSFANLFLCDLPQCCNQFQKLEVER